MVGSGTDAHPCVILDRTDLAAINEGRSLSYRLDADIDLTGADWVPLTPAGDELGPFTGKLDGNRHSIRNLRIDSPAASNIGLFSVTYLATISNLSLTDVHIAGDGTVGAVAALAGDTTLSHVSVTGEISAVDGYAGGLVGVTGDLTGGEPAGGGGIFGVHVEQVSSSASVTASSPTSTDVGGLVGQIQFSSTIADSRATGTVSGNGHVGGLVGAAILTDLAISRSLSTVEASAGVGKPKGGIVGYSEGAGTRTATDTYWNADAAGAAGGITGASPKTLAELKNSSTYPTWSISSDWSSATIWGICQAPDMATIPFLTWVHSTSPCAAPAEPTVATGAASAVTSGSVELAATVDANDSDTSSLAIHLTTSATAAASRSGDAQPTYPPTATGDGATPVFAPVTGLAGNTTYYYWVQATNAGGTAYGEVKQFTTPHSCATYTWSRGGDGTAANPYRVASAQDLAQAAECVDASFQQVADVSLAEFTDWTPVGTESSRFSGSYDGAHYRILNLRINDPALDGAGVFGWASEAAFSNLNDITGTVAGRNYAGGLVGYVVDSSISHVHSSTTVSGAGSYAGGLAGLVNGTAISASSAAGAVSAGSHTGGLAGYAGATSIVDSWASGDAIGDWGVGGLVGTGLQDSRITRSNATGAVTGTTRVGGLVGELDLSVDASSITVTDSYASGSASATSGAVGGLVGLARDVTSITRSYSTGGGSATMGGFAGYVSRATSAPASFWDSESSGQSRATESSSPGSVDAVGRTTAQMQDITTFTATGWDIESTCTFTSSVWAICPAINNGYPYLQRVTEPGPSPTPGPAPEPAPSPTGGGSGGGSSASEQAPAPALRLPAPSASGVPGPVAPTSPLTPGMAFGLLDGQPIDVTASSGPGTNSLTLRGTGFETSFDGVFRPSTSTRASAPSRVLLPGSTVAVRGSGARPGSSIALYAFSDATRLAVLTADSSGAYAGTLRVPSGLPLGNHALQVASTTPSDQSLVVSVGVTVARQARATTVTIVRFPESSTALTKAATARLASLARLLRSAREVTVACTGVVPRKRADAGSRDLAKRRAQRACDALSMRGVKAALTASTRTIEFRHGTPGGTVRVVTTQRISAA